MAAAWRATISFRRGRRGPRRTGVARPDPTADSVAWTQILLKHWTASADNHGMRRFALLLLLLSGLAFAPSASGLTDGNGNFRLGLVRAKVDSAIAARRLHVISDRAGFLATTSDDPLVDFEQYVFYTTPAGPSLLWRVTLGYRLDATRENFAEVEADLRQALGDPTDEPPLADTPEGRASERRMSWSDASVMVQLGARWRKDGDPESDRMRVTWTDRRLQRLVDARRLRERPSK